MKRFLAVLVAAFFMSGIQAERWIVRHGPPLGKLPPQARNVHQFKYLKATVVETADPDALRRLPGVTSVEPDTIVTETLLESTARIGATDAWSAGYEGDGIKIGIIDTGIDYLHEDLGGCFGVGCKVAGGGQFVPITPHHIVVRL